MSFDKERAKEIERHNRIMYKKIKKITTRNGGRKLKLRNTVRERLASGAAKVRRCSNESLKN